MTKAAARKRLREAESKVLNVMLAGHISVGSAAPLAKKLNDMAKRIK
jgi:hypothetical protein